MMTSHVAGAPVSVPDALAAEAEALARATGKTKREVVRDALRRHVQHEHFADLQRYGRTRAETIGVGPEESPRDWLTSCA